MQAAGAGSQLGPPRVSVVIPVFNLGCYVDEAVESVLAQSYQDVEILIVDDGSTDPETVRLLSDYRRPKTRVFRTENRGLAAARNYLIHRAGGELLCALDADDRLHPLFLEKTVARLDADPELTFVSTWLKAFGTESWDWRQERCDLPTLLVEDTVITAALVRREAVLAVGGYAEDMPAQGDEDWELWLRLVAAGGRGEVIPETLFFYRRRPGSMGEICTRGQTHLDLVRDIVRRHLDAYKANLPHVLRVKEQLIGRLLHDNDVKERAICSWLEPTVERRRAEVKILEEKLRTLTSRQAEQGAQVAVRRHVAELTRRVDELGEQLRGAQSLLGDAHGECRRLAAEVQALRASKSWQVTRPLRAGYEMMRWVKPGRGDGTRKDGG